ncbi:MAG: amino acid ABC transporter permease [Methylobacteriaceae bacterium]|nr:amino acid ABC transporter permease [Methylobacteriaceae bacterium]
MTWFGPGTLGYEIWIARGVLLNGLLITLSTSALIFAFGAIFGLLAGLCLIYAPWPVRWLLRVYVDVVRGLPVLVLLFFCYYGSALIGMDVSPYVAGVIALAAFCTAHTAEVTRGAFGSIPQAQTDAAKAIGLGFWGRLLHALGPQALRRMLPPWINTAVEMVKGTTLLSLIGVVDLLLATRQAISRNYMVLEFYGAVLVVYILICLAVSRLGALAERRLDYIRY